MLRLIQLILFHGKQILISVDQLINTFPFFGMADETLSARCWRNRNNSLYWQGLRILVDTVFFFDNDHCYNAWLAEVENKQLPKDYQ
jgi:hypothetical protein